MVGSTGSRPRRTRWWFEETARKRLGTLGAAPRCVNRVTVEVSPGNRFPRTNRGQDCENPRRCRGTARARSGRRHAKDPVRTRGAFPAVGDRRRHLGGGRPGPDRARVGGGRTARNPLNADAPRPARRFARAVLGVSRIVGALRCGGAPSGGERDRIARARTSPRAGGEGSGGRPVLAGAPPAGSREEDPSGRVALTIVRAGVVAAGQDGVLGPVTGSHLLFARDTMRQ